MVFCILFHFFNHFLLFCLLYKELKWLKCYYKWRREHLDNIVNHIKIVYGFWVVQNLIQYKEQKSKYRINDFIHSLINYKFICLLISFTHLLQIISWYFHIIIRISIPPIILNYYLNIHRTHNLALKNIHNAWYF